MAFLFISFKDRKVLPQKKTFSYLIIAILAGAYAFWAMMGAGENIVFYGSLLFFSSIPVYVWMKYREVS